MANTPPPGGGVNYQSSASQFAKDAGIDPNVFVKQIQAESGFNPRALSPAGAQGIAQFMPATAAGMGIDPWNALQALKAAAILDAANLQKYGGDYKKMLAAYNAGGGAVNSAVSRCGTGWLGCMPGETQHYVSTILGGSNPGTPASSTSPSTPATTASSGSMLDDIKRWGEYAAIFLLALLLVVVGFLLLNEQAAGNLAKTAAKAALL